TAAEGALAAGVASLEAHPLSPGPNVYHHNANSVAGDPYGPLRLGSGNRALRLRNRRSRSGSKADGDCGADAVHDGGGPGVQARRRVRGVRVRVVDLGLHALPAQIGVHRRALLVVVISKADPIVGRRTVSRLVRLADARGDLQPPADDEVARLQVGTRVIARGHSAARDLGAAEPFRLQRGAAPERAQLRAPLPDRGVVETTVAIQIGVRRRIAGARHDVGRDQVVITGHAD